MANYFASYDLNGPGPSHQQMDEHIENLGCPYARVLETVWYLAYPGTLTDLHNRLKSILRSEDLLLVIEAKDAAWTRLLVDSDSLKVTWRRAA